MRRKSKGKGVIGKEISSPISVSHGLHIDKNLEWSGPEAANQFAFEEKLGEGSFGAVYRATHKSAKMEFAIKTIPIQENDELGDIEQEITILKKCSSPNIVSYYGCFRNGKDFWIIMDYCVHGSLRDILDHMDNPLEEPTIASIMMGSLAGLAYLHGKNIIHRDIKAANILIDGNGTAKLADFGVSKQMANTWANTLVGTPLWMAPEVAKMQQYSLSADIWSIGITALELAQFYPPYADVTPMKALILITRNPPPKLNDGFSAEFNDFVNSCLHKRPGERPDAPTLLKHPFIVKSPDIKEAMKPVLEFSENYRRMQKLGTLPRTKSKRVPPTSPPPAPPSDKDSDILGGDDDEEASGTVIVKKPETAAAETSTIDSTVVVHPPKNAAQASTVVVESSGTVVRKIPKSSAIGSWARVHAAIQRQRQQHHVTIISPTATPPDGAKGGLVSKRDFFFIIVGALTVIMIYRMLHSLFGH